MTSLKRIFSVITLALLLSIPFSSVFAAGGPPKPGGTGPGCWPPPCVPIDGGISFLIAAGVGLGAKKLYESRKK